MIALPTRRALARPDLLLLVIASVIFTYVWRFQNVVPTAQMLRPTLLLGLAGLVAVVRLSPSHVAGRLRSPILALLALLVVIVTLGLPFALDPAGATRYLLTWMAPGVLLAFLIVVAVRNAEDVEWLVFATLMAAAVYVAILFARGGVNAPTDSAATVFYDRNELSLMLVAVLPATLHFARAGEPPPRRLLAAVCFLTFVLAVVRGGSRGGFIGLVLVLGYVLLTFRTVPRRARIWSAVAVLVLLAAGGSTYWQRMSTMIRPESDYNWSGQTYGRIALWRRGLGYIRERPVFGVGANGFPVAEATLSRVARQRGMVGRSFETLNPHNIFVQVAAELGLPGLTAFVLLLATMARTLSRVRRRFGADPVTGGVANVLLAALLGYVVCGFFLSAAYFPLLYLLIGLAAAVSAVARVPPAGPRMRAAASGEPRGQAARGLRAPYELPAPARW